MLFPTAFYQPSQKILSIHDFPDCLEIFKVTMYADDTAMYVSGKTKEDIEYKLEKDL